MLSRRRLFLAALVFLLPLGSAGAQEPDPALLLKSIQETRLDPGRAVAVDKVKLSAGPATVHLDSGLLLPTTEVGGKAAELVFLGKGRIVLEPPDAIEAGQLELFTGAARLDEEFQEAVFVVGLDSAVAAMLGKPAARPDAETARKAEALYTAWKGKPERRMLGVERGILLDALQDPSWPDYFAALFRGGDLGDFLYLVEPDAQEQVTLGHFVPLDATEKSKRKIAREINREQRKGRLIGLELDELGQWDTWVSASLRTADGKPTPGTSAFEPAKYTLDIVFAERDLRLTGSVRVDLRPVLKGSRAVTFYLREDFPVSRVTDAGGSDLFFRRSEGVLTVVLPRVPAEGEETAVVIEYAGSPIEKDWNLYTLLDTLGWHPRTGTIDRAPYEATFRWPKGFDLVASGRRMEGGEGADGRRWERRVLDVPSLGFSFEIGRFEVERAKAGHVDVTFAFGSGTKLTGRGTREIVKKAVTDSLLYYEEVFGPYPLDHLTVTTASRGFSQGMLGFVTLSDAVFYDLGIWNRFFGLYDPRLIVAHEVAHQWWGNQVGWTGYRDQWISEAMASYAALLYAKQRLGNELSGVDLTAGWRSELTAPLANGRPLESLGPVVLGARLISSRSSDAYQAIVYKKGAVVLDMLARTLGEETFPKVLRQIVKVAGGGTVSTGDLFSMIERITSTDLRGFADQFVYGTGLPEVLYNYRFEEKGGKWVVRGEARQQPPHRFRYKVIRTERGTFDVIREAIQRIDLQQSTLVVPIEIEVYDRNKPKGKGRDGANALIRGNIQVKGESTKFALEVANEPKGVWLDRDGRVLGHFFDENQNPKRALFFQGLREAAAGRLDEAAALYDQALAAKEPPPEDTGRTVYWQNIQWARRVLNALIELSRARLFLDLGRDEDAEASLDRAQKVLGKDHDSIELLQSRLDVRRGSYDRAFRRLRKGGAGSGETYALLAIAARETGHTEYLEEALKKARENGADLALLTGS
ncbi:MAG TPA: M1 family aminopeptidase [Thermoanaerobaculia bacterium]